MNIIPPNPLIPASLFVALLFVLAWSLRRRRVDDHPVCRRCGFDLTGRAPGSSVCSECGADLDRRRAIRHGNRVRHWRVARWAAVPLLLCGAWLGRSGWLASQGLDWQSDKPLWWLKIDARSKSAATRDAAVKEFILRLALIKLSDGQVATLADHALDLQADPARPWTSLWGQFLEDAYDAGRLPQERWERYARQSFDFHLDLRKQVRRGDPLVARIGLLQPRTGRARLVADVHGLFFEGKERIYDWRQDFRLPPYLAEVQYIKTLEALPGQGTAPWSGRIRENHIYPTPGFGITAAIDPPQFELPSDGPHTSSITLKVDVWDAWSSRIVSSFPLALRDNWTLVPADTPSVTLRHDASLRAALQTAMAVTGVRARVVRHGPDSLTYAMYAELNLTTAPLPVPMAFEVWLRGTSGEWKLDEENRTHLIRRGETLNGTPAGLAPHHLSTRDLALDFGRPGASVDVILRPAIAPAVLTPDVTEIWGEDIVFHGVPLTFAGPPANRASATAAASTVPSPTARVASPAATRASP